MALAVGLLLAVPALWIELGESGDAWWLSGVALVMGATGLALIWTGLTGVPPDFVDPDERG